jgi:hypothetical protein
LEVLERREVFSASPYLVPVAPSVEITPLITVGESVNNKPDGTPYSSGGAHHIGAGPGNNLPKHNPHKRLVNHASPLT